MVQEAGRVFAQVKLARLYQLPIRTIDFNDPKDKEKHDRMVRLVERMLELHRRLGEVRIPQDKRFLEAQIAATDREIDQLVYQLCGLTEEEIAIVEGTGNLRRSWSVLRTMRIPRWIAGAEGL